jgi:hypothetical protein
MSRPFRARGLALFAILLGAGCQDYNFNPVGHCLIQPGTKQVTLSNISTADVLFVIDESGSMGGEQAALATNFNAFVQNLDQANTTRIEAGLDPIDFHLAVTTTSVFWNYQTTQTCRSDCPGAGGQLVCCTAQNAPARKPRACAGPGAACPVAGTSCRLDCSRLQGAYHCCAEDGSVPPAAVSELIPCSRAGVMCGTMETHYDFQGCTSPINRNEWPYPRGDFVSRLAGPGGTPNPRVVHFDKELYQGPEPRTNRQGFASGELVTFFQQNVAVGTCGSGQEQALQGARLALQKALSGQQRDTYGDSRTPVWTEPTATAPPASVPARWPNPNSKIVLVFVGDEDDCSSPPDPSGGVVMLAEPAGADACSRDGLATTDASIRNKQYAVQEFVDYFTSLGRPVAAAFIFPAAQNQCTLATCTTEGVCCPPNGCTPTEGAQGRGVRLLLTAQALALRGVEVVAASICDGDFRKHLEEIAEIVKPPSGLKLPTAPAADEVTLLRIAATNGQTRKICSRPAPAGLALAEAQDALAADGQPYDWWFTVDGNPGGSTGVSRFVYINPKGNCRANPGETYSADYLGRLPEGGCTSHDHCRQALGGDAESWTCFAGVQRLSSGDEVCIAPSASAPGTCICGSPAENRCF